MLKKFFQITFVVVTFIATSTSFAQKEVNITSQHIAGNVYMLSGGGGNIGVCIGEDGIFMVDDQMPQYNAKVMETLKSISSANVKIILNTHYHFDHVGANIEMNNTGAVIVAHKNVRKRLMAEQVIDYVNMKRPPMPHEGLPVITFAEDISFHFNNDEIIVVHVDPAHTDGDSFVYFKNANVLHMGDLMFFGMYPFVDLQNNGSVSGYLKAYETILPYINEDTKIIPGHGADTDYQGFVEYQKMLETIINRVSKMIDEGKTLEEIIAAKPCAEYDEVHNNSFTPTDKFIGFIYDELTE